MKNKRGELTTKQLVGLIILIVSFAIILFLIFRLNFGEETESEVCHNSVVLKSNSVLPGDTVSLKCKRKYICITEDGSCENGGNSEIEKVNDLGEVYQILADEMTDCWWVYGEGKIDYVGKDATKKNYCSICAQLNFDDSLENLEGVEEGIISKDKLYNYLASKKRGGEDSSYLRYLFGTDDLNSLKQVSTKQGIVEGTFGNIDLGKKYFVVMGITSEVSKFSWAAIGAAAGLVVGSVVAIATPVGWTAGLVIVGAAVIGGGVVSSTVGTPIVGTMIPEIGAITVKGNGVPNQFMAPTIQEAESERYTSLNCEDVLSLG